MSRPELIKQLKTKHPKLNKSQIETIIDTFFDSIIEALKEGKKFITNKIAIGPPIIIPKVPVKNIINAFEPSLLISFKSTLNVSRTNDVGSKYLEATKYNKFDFSGETIPIVFNNEGIK